MKSILDNRPALAYAVNQAAEVAGYLWQKGWAERNGGNITLNITEFVDDEIKALPAISEVKQIGTTLPHLKGCYFYCKGTNKRMRDLSRWPMEHGSIIRILDDCATYVIIADQPVNPTSELPAHLCVHNRLIEKGSPYKASLHTHPIELIAMTHCKKFLEKDESLLPARPWYHSLRTAQFSGTGRSYHQAAGRLRRSHVGETRRLCRRRGYYVRLRSG